nr:protein UL84 [Murid betaherpesvirus 2]
MLLPAAALIKRHPHPCAREAAGRPRARTTMAVTVRTSDASRSTAGTQNRLSYTLELLIDLDVSFDPYETKLLDTGVRVTPHTACILFCTKISSAASPPHAVDFVALGPNARDADEGKDRDRAISMEVSNPSGKTLPPQGTPLRLILFALPLAPVRLDLLWIQKRPEDPRNRPRFPISILSVTPGVHSLDVELVATGLSWRAYPRDRRLMTVIPLDMFRADIRRYCTAEIRSCTQKGVYVHEVTTTQTTGNAYLTLLTRTEEEVPPSSLVLRIVFREEETLGTTPPIAVTGRRGFPPAAPSQRWVAFNTSPDPTFCVPHGYGITITCPRNVHLFPGHQSRVDISVSFCSERAHLGLFIPAPRENVSCQIVAWKERQTLSLALTATVSTDLARGDLLGDAYFLPSNAPRVRRTTPPAPTSRYTALLTDPGDPTGKGGGNRLHYQQHRRTGPDGRAKRGVLTSGERDLWAGYPPPEARRKRTHAEILYSGYPIAYPNPSTAAETPAAAQGEAFSDDDDTLEIYPCGTIFKLKQLIPLVLEESNERRDGPAAAAPRGPPKKIGTVTSLRRRGRWTAERAGEEGDGRTEPRLAWRETPAESAPEP